MVVSSGRVSSDEYLALHSALEATVRVASVAMATQILVCCTLDFCTCCLPTAHLHFPCKNTAQLMTSTPTTCSYSPSLFPTKRGSVCEHARSHGGRHCSQLPRQEPGPFPDSPSHSLLMLPSSCLPDLPECPAGLGWAALIFTLLLRSPEVTF